MAEIITVKGVVVSERNVGENDKFISVLTENYGTIDVFARGTKKITSKNHAATQLFAYADFCIRSDKDRYFLDSSEIIQDFYNLRLDIKKLSLACYFGELSRHAVLASDMTHEHEIMRLILNCLYFLDTDKRSCEYIKSVFELRFIIEIGLAPRLIGCGICYDYRADPIFFVIKDSRFYCEYHFRMKSLEENYYNVRLTNREFCILQGIGLTSMDKLFSVKVTDTELEKINEVTEKYICFQLGRKFNSLNYYHEICNPFEKGYIGYIE